MVIHARGNDGDYDYAVIEWEVEYNDVDYQYLEVLTYNSVDKICSMLIPM